MESRASAPLHAYGILLQLRPVKQSGGRKEEKKNAARPLDCSAGTICSLRKVSSQTPLRGDSFPSERRRLTRPDWDEMETRLLC